MRRALAALAVLLLGWAAVAHAQVPAAAQKYRTELTRSAQSVWGLHAPVPALAAQIHQESGWRPEVCSPFACGLTQFTAPTAEWIAGAYRGELGSADPKAARFDSSWAIRALVRYDRHLYDRLPAATECDQFAMVLASYNGGEGWVKRDQRLAAARGADPARWWGHVELHSARAAWAFKENRDYPRRILLQHQGRYASWGRVIACEK